MFHGAADCIPAVTMTIVLSPHVISRILANHFCAHNPVPDSQVIGCYYESQTEDYIVEFDDVPNGVLARDDKDFMTLVCPLEKREQK